jgi:sortase A
MTRKRSAGWFRAAEFLLTLGGTLCLGFCALVAIQSTASSRVGARFGTIGASAQGQAEDVPGPATVMGRLEIPSLGLSVPVLSDYETSSLLKGIGHIPGTAMPGGLGTLGLAGHRDTYFRPLRNIKKNMDIRVVGADGTYHYLVDSTEIVKPENVQVLDIVNRPELTLITCYPFYYVGSAPLRFIVHAHLLSALPDPVSH